MSHKINESAAIEHLMRFLSVEGVTGEEAAIAAAVSDELKKVGVPESAIRFDDVRRRTFRCRHRPAIC
jgi:tripeptide aminopeptidase